MANNATNVGRALGALVPAAVNLRPGAAGNVLRRILDVAIDGAGRLPGAREAAAKQLQKTGDVEAAIDSLVTQHVSLAGAQGFVTNIGGLVTTVVSLPANVAGAAVLQTRMIAAIAHLKGYDVTDDRVRTAIGMCLVGDDLERILEGHDLPTRPLVVATAPVFDGDLERAMSDRIAAELVARITGKRMVVAMTKRIPVLGGGVGAAFDGWDTWTIAKYARTEFVARRRLTSHE
ncbi:EcsC family protein [Mariniluteicoccus endophyticus]